MWFCFSILMMYQQNVLSEENKADNKSDDKTQNTKNWKNREKVK